MTKLLNRQLKVLSVFALIVLISSVPVYYYVVDSIWLHELDEHNQVIKDRLVHQFSSETISDEELEGVIHFWQVLEPGTTLTPSEYQASAVDSIYEVERINEFGDNGLDRYRGLKTQIEINDQNYVLTVETNVEEADETIALIGLVTLVFFIFMIVGFIILNKRISKKIWEPFQSTLTKLKDFQLTDEKSIVFDKTTISEFQTLNEELEVLIENNIIAFQKQKRFVENASHELQTPLAVLKSKLDLLLQSEDLTQNQMDLVNFIATPLSRLSRLNKNLLLLAKIENHQFETEDSQSIKNVIEDSINLLEDYVAQKDLALEVEISHDHQINANKFLLETLINNLLTNAIKHSKPNVSIKLILKENQLTISNPGKQSLDQFVLFDRFSNSSVESGNTGLGLAIAKEICTRNKWNLTYEFHDGQHRFIVTF